MARKAKKVPEFGAWLDQQIRSRGWNLSEFARRSGASPSMVSKWTRGTQPTTQSIDRIADALRIDADVVLTLAGHRPVEIEFDPNSAKGRLINKLQRIDFEEKDPRVSVLDTILDGMLEDQYREGRRDQRK